ncbi:5-oxoprolinase subunit B family protein [Polymorphobacter fuscus]|uniref:Carboxyltransferase domain-containing protein n=1 Tax=Sandarakinorhabdus fusca TaxID=1439888 RepID=A0A7C9GWZ7_9SPHN|nr:allophanate hydrolase subunit 1 [Polymorphobacter fuscus]KAB7647602.1 allophanate hydrolase subunit 1 [Polymorphobacter fuscus]MQT16874.1 carboxyltransferase domain-containing protein [Polymorphobacter fuscus]NJC09137.1 inhibitor of KinA [Polymorphobacter fuscus]
MAPTVQPVGDTAVLLGFGDAIDPAVFDGILALEAAIIADPPPGLVETVPAYVTLLIVFDPLVTDGETIAAAALARTGTARPTTGALHWIAMCSDAHLAPDLADVADRVAMPAADVLAAHFATEYRVYMYGFAPGYAYMDGVVPALQLPRKPVPVRSRPTGSVMIAGGQCLITTLPMPTGWWVIGATTTQVLRPDGFLFQPGDRVRFTPQPRADFDARI